MTTEHHRALAWRKARKLSRRALSELTGFSPSSIEHFERGSRADGKPITASAWTRYRMACAAVEGELTPFAWEPFAK